MSTIALDHVWRVALAIIPFAVIVAAATRLLPFRPATRHLMWVALLLLLVAVPFLPPPPVGDLAAIALPRSAEAPAAPHATAPRIAGRDVPSAASAPLALDRALDPTVPENEAAPTASGVPAAPTRSDLESGVKPSDARSPAPALAAEPTHPSGESPAQVAAAHEAPVDRAPLRAWAARALTALVIARDAIVALPAMPVGAWAIGAAIALALSLGRAARIARIVRRGTAAPRDVRAIVAESAAAAGLPRPPRVLMTSARICPLVWCGWRPVIVVPEGLWRELDDVGRRAVLVHEIAHLRRRDHWVCWIALIAGCVYWWHPVAWWILRRIRDEADVCCDVWVTELLPGARRAYATALLQTRRFTSRAQPALPAVALGATSPRAKRLARRITMVMTKHMTPRLTLGGALLAGLTATICWLVTPTLACPPEERESAAKPPPPPVVIHRATPWADDATTTFERFMTEGERDDMTLEERIEQLEAQIDALIERLMNDLQGRLPQPEQIEQWAQAAQVEAESALAADSPLARIPIVGQLFSRQGECVVAQAACCVSDCACVGGRGECACEQTSHTYALSGGKLEALSALMSLADVPVLVTPHEDGIEVHGTPPQHRIFASFVRMIAPESAAHAGAETGHAQATHDKVAQYEALAREHALAEIEAAEADYHAQRAAHETQMKAMHDELRMVAESRRQQERRARDLHREGQNVTREGDRLRSRAARIEAALERAQGQERERLLREAEELAAQADETETRAADLEAEAEAVEAGAEDLERRQDEIAEAIEEIRAEIEAIAEEVAELKARIREGGDR
jgi:beta-lactamase regulating signal transducer with metallopeptidase domain